MVDEDDVPGVVRTVLDASIDTISKETLLDIQQIRLLILNKDPVSRKDKDHE